MLIQRRACCQDRRRVWVGECHFLIDFFYYFSLFRSLPENFLQTPRARVALFFFLSILTHVGLCFFWAISLSVRDRTWASTGLGPVRGTYCHDKPFGNPFGIPLHLSGSFPGFLSAFGPLPWPSGICHAFGPHVFLIVLPHGISMPYHIHSYHFLCSTFLLVLHVLASLPPTLSLSDIPTLSDCIQVAVVHVCYPLDLNIISL